MANISPPVTPPEPVDEATGLSASDVARLRQRLIDERRSVLARLRGHVGHATEDDTSLADEMDQASRDQDQALLLRLADKEHKLLNQIDRALQKFDDGSYGLCEGTGEPIGLRRLELQPWARYSVMYKEQLERQQRSRHALPRLRRQTRRVDRVRGELHSPLACRRKSG